MKWRIARLKEGTFQFWNDRKCLWVTDKSDATLYGSEPVVAYDSHGGRIWAEIARGHS